MNPLKILSWLDRALERKDLPKESRNVLQAARVGLMQSLMDQGAFLGEQLEGGTRNIPGAEGSGVVIQPQQVPSGHIRDFIPNPATQGDLGATIGATCEKEWGIKGERVLEIFRPSQMSLISLNLG